MKIDGIYIEKDELRSLCRVDEFSEELKTLIRSQLSSLAYGKAAAETNPTFYSYNITLKSFLDRFNTKSDDIKKGMVGELLSHVLIPVLYEELISLSVLFNKEERSIKKGFDIIYFREQSSSLWYSEVKSGSSNSGTAADSNRTLLTRAKKDIQEKFSAGRHSLWETAMADAQLVLGDKRHSTAKLLLSQDSPLLGGSDTSNDKNVILISVLYECPKNPFSLKCLIDFHAETKNEKIFGGAIIFSIQKKTYDKVADFFESEVKGPSANV